MTASPLLTLVFILMIPLASAGLALVNTGLGRSRSAAHAMLSSLCVLSVAGITYILFGFAWQGWAEGPAHSVLLGGRPWNWIAAGPFFLRGIPLDGSPVSLTALFQMLCVGLAALIPLGSGGDRWRLGASCASAALLAGWTYPVFAHWVWAGGWLAQLGANYGLGHGFQDTGGAGSIHVLGGFTALSITWILGPRRGKYVMNGMPAAVPGHNAILVLFACFVAWLGWSGLNSAGALLFGGAEAGHPVLVSVNTTLCAAAGVLTAAAITGGRFGKPDASLCANGGFSGLVASSAVAAFVTPAASIVVGAVAGALVTFTVAWLEWPLSVDDPTGAVSVHAVGGIWGLLAFGILAHFRDAASGQWLAQLIGVATLLGFVLPVTYTLNWLLNRIYPQRVAPDGERQGMDLYELGAGAYPEFVTHGDEFTQP